MDNSYAECQRDRPLCMAATAGADSDTVWCVRGGGGAYAMGLLGKESGWLRPAHVKFMRCSDDRK